MRQRSAYIPAIALSAVLATPLAGCACSNQQQPQQDGTPQATTQQDEPTELTKKIDEGKLDVQAAAPSATTFFGDKLIVSDATDTQSGLESNTGDLGTQEMCLIKQPESWTEIESIGWGRNYISYNNIATPWGSVSYSYTYNNEAGVTEDLGEFSLTTPESFFGSMDDVKELEVNGQKALYVRNDAPSVADRFMFEDLEAAMMGVERDTSQDVGLHIYEQRGDKCSFVVTVTCKVDQADAFGTSDEDLVKEALSVANFTTENAEQAASYLSDVVFTSADGSKQVLVKRNGADLMSYTQHGAILAESDEGAEMNSLLVEYDFASGKDADAFATSTADTQDMSEDQGFTNVEVSDIVDREVDGYTVHARTVSADIDMIDEVITQRQLRGWIEYDGQLLGVEASMKDGEDMDAAIARVISNRLTLSAAS